MPSRSEACGNPEGVPTPSVGTNKVQDGTELPGFACRENGPNPWRSKCLNGSIRAPFTFFLFLHAFERCEQGFIFLAALAAAGEVVSHGFERVRNRPTGKFALRKLRHHVAALAAVDLKLPRDAQRAHKSPDLIVA